MRNSFAGMILCNLIGLLFLFLSGRAIYEGHISIGRYHHTIIYAASNPLEFWLFVFFYAAIGIFLIALPFFRK